MNLNELWLKIKALVETEAIEPAPVTRALSMDTLYSRVWEICEMYPMAYLRDVFTDQAGTIFALISQDGRLYRSTITVGEADSVTLGEWEMVTQEFVSAGMERTTITRQADGSVRWLSISATATINRDGEIDSRQLFDNFVKRAEESGQYPQRVFFHTNGKKYVTGQADFLARSGNCYITGGVYNDTFLALAEIKAREAEPDYWGDSIGYAPIGPMEFIKVRGFDIPVYKDGVNVEISTLPSKDASSLFIRTEVKRNMNQRQMEALAKLAFEGDLERAKKWVEENPDEVNRQIDQAGLVTRATGEAQEFELTDEAIGIIVQRTAESEVIRAQATKIEEQASTITTLNGKVVSLETTLSQLEMRLRVVEQTDQERRREVVRDLPANALITKLTYRPSVERGTEQAVEKTSAEIADATLNGAGLKY